MILLYLKLAPSNLSNCKIWCRVRFLKSPWSTFSEDPGSDPLYKVCPAIEEIFEIFFSNLCDKGRDRLVFIIIIIIIIIGKTNSLNS